MNEKRDRKRGPHWDSDADTERLTACYPVGDGWAVFVGFQSFDGVVEVVEESLLYVGDAVGGMEDIAEHRAEAMAALLEPIPPERRMTEQRRRAVKVGRYVNDARQRLAGDPTLATWLTRPGWARDVPTDPRKLTDRDYAERARDFLRLGGQYGPLADAYGVATGTARAWIEEARDRGLLTKPGQRATRYLDDDRSGKRATRQGGLTMAQVKRRNGNWQATYRGADGNERTADLRTQGRRRQLGIDRAGRQGPRPVDRPTRRHDPIRQVRG